jgi:DNA (cytosine-5)-methyltransferase 1
LRSQNTEKNVYKVGELFAGIGAIGLAFKKAGFEIVWANENDKNACRTYKANFKNTLYEQDIKTLDPEKLAEIDILTAGFPCQAFSIAGYRKGFADERGNLFFDILRFAKVLLPKVIFLENVKNLLSHDSGNTFKIIKEHLEELGYFVAYKVLNTCLYSNLPQNRERIYIVCFRDETKKNIFERSGWPAQSDSSKRLAFEEIVENYADEIHYFDKSKYYYEIAIKEVDDQKAFYQWRRTHCRKNKNGLCPALTANMGGGGHNVPLIMDKKGLRRLTPEECLRLQGINPQEFAFAEKTAFGAKYKQIGNSVSVPVVKSIAENILKIL